MADVYEWLGGVNPPMDGIFVSDPMDQIMPLGIDKDGNTYFDVNDEPFPIDPSLVTMADPSAQPAPGQTVVMVPEQLAGDYRHKVRLETRKKKMDSIKKLRSGRKVRM
jgi:hypothetical protein